MTTPTYPTGGTGFVGRDFGQGLTMVAYDYDVDRVTNFAGFASATVVNKLCATVSQVNFLDEGGNNQNDDPDGLDFALAGDATDLANAPYNVDMFLHFDPDYSFIPLGNPNFVSDTVAVKFCGFIFLPTGTTKFRILHDDGVEMYLDGQLVMRDDSTNNFGVLPDNSPNEVVVNNSWTVSERTKLPIVLAMFDSKREANIVLQWSVNDGPWLVVPQADLEPAPKPVGGIPYVCNGDFEVGSTNCGGDPHFKRFGQDRRDSFHGECDLVLAHSEAFYEGAGLDIHIRTTMQDFYSYIESAAVKIGQYVLEINKGNFLLDGTPYDESDLPLTFGEKNEFMLKLVFEAKDRRHYYLDFGNSGSVTFKYYKNYMNIDAPGHYELTDNKGLMGSYPNGEMIGRSGKEMSDFVEFGFEWQVSPEDPQLFSEARSPQLPYEQCRLPTAAKPSRRHLRNQDFKLHGEAQKACAKVQGSDFDLCVEDVMLTGDIGMAENW